MFCRQRQAPCAWAASRLAVSQLQTGSYSAVWMWCQAWAYTDELSLSKAYWAGFSVMLSTLTCRTCTKHLVWSGIPEIYRTFLLTLLLPNQIHIESNPLFIQVNGSFWTDFGCDRFKKKRYFLWSAPLPALTRPLYNKAFTLLLMIMLKKSMAQLTIRNGASRQQAPWSITYVRWN